jgi:hypothetical protein
VRAVDSPVPGSWDVVSESWGCDVHAAAVEGPGPV